MVENPSVNAGDKRCRFDPWVGKIPLEEGMATHSSILAWRIPWIDHGVAKRQTRLSDSHNTTRLINFLLLYYLPSNILQTYQDSHLSASN